MLTSTRSLDDRDIQGLGGGNVWLHLFCTREGAADSVSRQGNNTRAGGEGCDPGIGEDRH